MKAKFNLEDSPGKVVGHRVAPDSLAITPAQTKAHSIAWRNAFGGLRVKKAVYRFRTHEEADAWLWEKMTRGGES